MANNNSNGVSGNNVITGGSGNDKLNGGASSDTLNGGAGNDSLNGDSSNDSLIYGLAENGGATDIYTGGSGIDTVRIDLTQAEWMNAAVEYQLARYYQHLLTVKTNPKTGEVSNGAASDFTFDFGNGSKLTVQMMERLEIAVDGVVVTNQDQPVIKNGPQAAGVVEDGDSDASASTAQSTSGTLTFFDLDLTDSHVVSVATPAGAYGALTASVSNATLGDSQGTVAWSYQLNNAAVQFLAAGETRTEVFTVRIADANNAANFAETQVTLTITGTNDVPVITTQDLIGGVTELVTPAGNLTDSGAISFSDVDLLDVHVVSAAPIGTTLGSLSAIKNTDTTGSGTGGQLTWTYSVAASAVEYLAAGQTKVESFTVTLDDQNGGVVSRQVDVTLTGTNDLPVITAQDLIGGVTELVTPAGNLTDSGAISFSDVDLTDAHLVSTTGAPVGTTLGSLSAVKDSDTTGSGTGGQLTWTYSVAASAVEYLAAGQTKVESFTISLDDQNGGVISKQIDVTITGTNDVAVITAADLAGGVTELVTATGNLTDSGTISFSDVDLTDAHLVGAASVGATLGSLTAVKNTDTTGTGTGGQVTWNYTVPASAVESLAAGQTKVESFTISIDDQKGGVTTTQVDVTITGTNDVPVITAQDLAGGVTELVAPAGNLTDGGAISFSDVDLNDVHIVSPNGTPIGSALGSLTAAVSTDTTGSGTGGQVTWNYSVPASAVEFLAAGQTKVESFNISLSDQNGGIVNRQVNVVITGTNDVPVITSEDLSGAIKVPVQEVAAPPSPLVFTVQQFLGYQSNDLNTLRSYASSHTANYTVQTNVIDYTDDTDGFAGELPGSSRWPAAVAQGAYGTGGLNDVFFAKITAEFSVNSADTYTFRTFNDDGVFLLIDNTLVISDTGYHPEVAFNGSIALTPGNHTIELFFFENGGEASLEFSARTSTGTFGLVGGTGAGFGGSLAQVTDSGVITFSDVDLNDVHLVSATGTPVGTTLGSLSAVKNIDTTGAGTGGQLTWTYTASSSALVYLGEGQTKVESFTITLNDQHGGLITKQIDVTITGTNEGPIIGAQHLSGALVEQLTPSGMLEQNGHIEFTDADLSDVHLASVAPQGATLGTLHATINSDTTGTGTGGHLHWHYMVDAAAIEYLAANENKIETFTVTLDDQHGGQVTRQVSITITGTNDAAIISSAVANLVETNAPLSTGGQLTISDVDNPATFVAQAGTAGAYGVFGINASGNWTYNTNGALNQLAPGQNVTDVFNVSSADGTTSTVTVNILGTADGPVANDDSSQLTTLVAQTVTGNTVYWADWQSVTQLSAPSPGVDGSYRVNGTISLPGGHNINVTYEGQYFFAQTAAGQTYYYTQPNGAVYTSAAVGNGPGTSDIIALGDAASARNLTFSEPVENLFFAIVSMNSNGYLFDQDFNIVSSGQGYFGYAQNITKSATGDGRFGITSSGNPSEFHGVLQVDGAVSSLTWTSQADEYWNGFTVGTYGVAQTASVSGNALTNDVANNLGDSLHVSAVNGSTISGNSVTLTLASGATIKVDKDGDYFYNDNGAFASLGAGDTFTETVQYTAMDIYGGTDNAEIRIVVQGVNDKAVLGAATAQLVETNSPLSTSGVLSISDADQDEQVFITQSGTAGAHGVFNINSAGNWSYNTTGALDHLAAGQTVSDVFNVSSADGTTTSVTVNILGANDAPVISTGGAVAGAVTEDTTVTVTGQLTASDVDTGATRSWSVAGGGSGSYGSLSVNSSGLWTYNLNNNATAVQALTTGQTRTENFNVVVTDQYGATDTEAVTITVNGKNESLIVTPLSRTAAEDKIDGSIQTVLFIDDDRGLNGQGTWFSALTANGYSYSYEQIAADANPTSNLANFDLVIWTVGDRAYTNLTAANVTTLTTYLNGGGRLLYAGGHDVYSEPNISTFAPNYLGISNYQSNMPTIGSATPATGPGGSYTLNTWAGGEYQGTMISAFGATGAGTTSLMKLTTGSTYRDVASVKVGSNFVAGVWGFDINQLGAAYRTDFLGDTLDALGGGFHVDLLTGASDPAGGTLSITSLKQISGASVGAIVTGKELSLEASDLLYLTAGQTETLVYEFGVSNGTTTTTNTITIAVSGTNVVPSGVVYDHALVGEAGKDILLGGAGADTLTGGAGADKFVFTASNQGFDKITDFSIVDDLLVVHATGFGGGLVAGAALAASQLVAAAGAVATQAIGQFLYDTSNGVLSWDQDGTGADVAIPVVELVGIPALTATDFQVV